MENLIEGKEIEDNFAVREKEPPREYTGGWFFRLIVGDKTGNIPLVYWGEDEREPVESKYKSIKVGDVVEIKGVVSRYHGKLQISINMDHFHSIRKIDEEYYDVEDYLKTSKRDIDDMLSELLRISKTIENEHLKNLLNLFFEDDDFVESFKKCPYSKKYNNNFIGGLLEHTLNDTKMADFVSRLYSQLDRDLLVTAAIVHDFGKVREYETTTSIELTTESRLIGHTVMCEQLIREKVNELPSFPKDLTIKLSHVILSHHGDYEWGSARSPRMEEAVALHHIDLMDVRLSGFIQAKEELPEEDEEMIYVSKEGVQRPIFTQ